MLFDYKIIHGLHNEFSHLYHLYMTVGIDTFTPYFLDDDQNMLITKFLSTQDKLYDNKTSLD